MSHLSIGLFRRFLRRRDGFLRGEDGLPSGLHVNGGLLCLRFACVHPLLHPLLPCVVQTHHVAQLHAPARGEISVRMGEISVRRGKISIRRVEDRVSYAVKALVAIVPSSIGGPTYQLCARINHGYVIQRVFLETRGTKLHLSW